MGLRRTLTTVATAAALAAPIAVVSAAPAAAETSYARLSIVPSVSYAGYYEVYVWGHIHNAPANATVGMRLKGDDPIWNDDLEITRTGTAFYGDFSLYIVVWHGWLNEDWEGQDEIFASVSSSTGWRKDTNNVKGYF